MSKFYDFLVFIDRFQPSHQGHLVVCRALEQAEIVIVLCGSARQPPSIRNPWSSREVKVLIDASLETAVRDRAEFVLVRFVNTVAPNLQPISVSQLCRDSRVSMM